MYHKLLLSTIFYTLCFSASAQEEQIFKSYCDKTEKIFNDLRINYSEQPLLAGKGPEGTTGAMTLWINPTTKSWTILVTYPEKTCVIGSGVDLTLLRTEKSNQNVPKSNL